MKKVVEFFKNKLVNFKKNKNLLIIGEHFGKNNAVFYGYLKKIHKLNFDIDETWLLNQCEGAYFNYFKFANENVLFNFYMNQELFGYLMCKLNENRIMFNGLCASNKRSEIIRLFDYWAKEFFINHEDLFFINDVAKECVCIERLKNENG